MVLKLRALGARPSAASAAQAIATALSAGLADAELTVRLACSQALARELEIGQPVFATEDAREGPRAFAERPSLTLVCGRYEGVDERARDGVDFEVSLGDFVVIGPADPGNSVGSSGQTYSGGRCDTIGQRVGLGRCAVHHFRGGADFQDVFHTVNIRRSGSRLLLHATGAKTVTGARL